MKMVHKYRDRLYITKSNKKVTITNLIFDDGDIRYDILFNKEELNNIPETKLEEILLL